MEKLIRQLTLFLESVLSVKECLDILSWYNLESFHLCAHQKERERERRG